MTIRVVIKGAPKDARQAAKKRGIALQQVQEGRHGDTLATAGSRFAKPIWDWFHERHEVASDKGYPPGTLLFYRER